MNRLRRKWERSVQNDDHVYRTTITFTERRSRLQNAALDLVVRQSGAMYGPPQDIYRKAGLDKHIADEMDVVALCRVASNNVKAEYPVAVRLGSDGQVDVLLPNETSWMPYYRAGAHLGKTFAKVRHLHTSKLKRGESPAYLSSKQMADFAATVFGSLRAHPTLVVVDADGWRGGEVWPQLQNGALSLPFDVLKFEKATQFRSFSRDHTMASLLGIVRLRDDTETPQYIPRDKWEGNAAMRDFGTLSGFLDQTTDRVVHYFSTARLPNTQKGLSGRQDLERTRDIYKLGRSENPKNPQFVDYGSKIAFKHPQLIEMLPFFVHGNFEHEQGRVSLCRVLHFLRISPAWTMGNILMPYPLHLGTSLIANQLCILGED